MRVIVAGAGQMGSLYAAAFSENGHETTLFDRNSELVTAVRTRGLVIVAMGTATLIACLQRTIQRISIPEPISCCSW
jgi:ketopantoate reductase